MVSGFVIIEHIFSTVLTGHGRFYVIYKQRTQVCIHIVYTVAKNIGTHSNSILKSWKGIGLRDDSVHKVRLTVF